MSSRPRHVGPGASFAAVILDLLVGACAFVVAVAVPMGVLFVGGLSESSDKHVDWSSAARAWQREIAACAAIVVVLALLAALLLRVLLRGVVRFIRVLAIHLGVYATGAAAIVAACALAESAVAPVLVLAALATFTILPVVAVFVSADWPPRPSRRIAP